MTGIEQIGELLIEGDTGTVRMDDLYKTDIDDLWGAITNPERIARWFGTVTGDLRPGAIVQLSLVSSWDGPAIIKVCEAPHHLMLLANPGADDETRMEATLTREGTGTRLVIEESGFTLRQLPFHGSGWQAHIEDLHAYLDGRPTGDWKTRWEELTPAYQRRMPAQPGR